MIVVETGSINPDANTLIDTGEADQYHNDRAHTTWTKAQNNEKQTALVRACDYLNAQEWTGEPVNMDQPLCFPRKGIEGIPGRVKNALCEAALCEIMEPGSLHDVPSIDRFPLMKSLLRGFLQ